MRRPWLAVAAFGALFVTAESASAQTMRRTPNHSCQTSPSISVGGAAGYGSTDTDLTHTGSDPNVFETRRAKGGAGVWTARSDINLAPRLRARVEASQASWGVEQDSYVKGDDPTRVTRTPAGSLSVGSVRGTIGTQFASAGVPMCGYVMFGVSTNRLRYQDLSERHGGWLFALGLDFPTGERGKVQFDVQLNGINTPNSSFVAPTTMLTLGVSAGWMWRF